MKHVVISFLAILCFAVFHVDESLAQEGQHDQHLLDGTSAKYYYQNGSGIHIQFYSGKLKYEWITGPRKGHGNKDLSY